MTEYVKKGFWDPDGPGHKDFSTIFLKGYAENLDLPKIDGAGPTPPNGLSSNGKALHGVFKNGLGQGAFKMARALFFLRNIHVKICAGRN